MISNNRTKPYKYDGNLAVDDRGSVRFVNDFTFEGVKRFYQVENIRSGYIRAWHGHKIEGKYVYVVKGSILLGVVNMETKSIEKFILNSLKPQVIYIPPNHYNGFKTLEEDTIVMFFSTTTLDESLNDDYRLPYNEFNIWEENYR